jgi:flagellin
LDQNIFQYTVTATDVAGGSGTIATSLKDALVTRFDDGYNIATTGAADVTFTLDGSSRGSVAGNSISLKATSSDGEWDDLETLKIKTQTDSNSAISGLDASITKVNKARAEIGAVINRLTYAVDNLTNISANATASRSRIEDTDYAKATTSLARSQIIQQAATAMLAQANQQPQSVLSLLK